MSPRDAIAHVESRLRLPNGWRQEDADAATTLRDVIDREQRLSAEAVRLRALNAELVASLEALRALVLGECPSLLENDHHDGMVRAALAKARGEPKVVNLMAALKESCERAQREAAACPGTFQPIARVPGTLLPGFQCDACGVCVTRRPESGLCAEVGL